MRIVSRPIAQHRKQPPPHQRERIDVCRHAVERESREGQSDSYVEEGETFATLVGKTLASGLPAGYHLEVANAGVSSLTAHQTFAHVRERALTWAPDAVVWGFYVERTR